MLRKEASRPFAQDAQVMPAIRICTVCWLALAGAAFCGAVPAASRQPPAGIAASPTDTRRTRARLVIFMIAISLLLPASLLLEPLLESIPAAAPQRAGRQQGMCGPTCRRIAPSAPQAPRPAHPPEWLGTPESRSVARCPHR